jgi:branched-chain amino acid transport system permease protein
LRRKDGPLYFKRKEDKLSLIISQILNGITVGVIYILLALGLSIIFGMLGIVNFAHGAFYAIAAYLAYTFTMHLGNFWTALLTVPILMGIFGIGIEFLILRRMYDKEVIYQFLLTFGIAFVAQEIITIFWGPMAKSLPPQLPGFMDLGFMYFPKYRLFLVVLTSIIVIFVWLFIEKTKYGSIIRAGTENSPMASCLGINISNVFTLVFGFGACLAGLAGVLSAPIRSLKPYMGWEILVTTFVVVVIGGMGSLSGALIGGILIGLAQSLTSLVWPIGTNIVIFFLMAVILLLRPYGLLGRM